MGRREKKKKRGRPGGGGMQAATTRRRQGTLRVEVTGGAGRRTRGGCGGHAADRRRMGGMSAGCVCAYEVRWARVRVVKHAATRGPASHASGAPDSGLLGPALSGAPQHALNLCTGRVGWGGGAGGARHGWCPSGRPSSGNPSQQLRHSPQEPGSHRAQESTSNAHLAVLELHHAELVHARREHDGGGAVFVVHTARGAGARLHTRRHEGEAGAGWPSSMHLCTVCLRRPLARLGPASFQLQAPPPRPVASGGSQHALGSSSPTGLAHRIHRVERHDVGGPTPRVHAHAPGRNGGGRPRCRAGELAIDGIAVGVGPGAVFAQAGQPSLDGGIKIRNMHVHLQARGVRGACMG